MDNSSIGCMAMIAVYFAPAFVALIREHHNSLAIATLNLFLGLTVIGWVVALVWALTNPPEAKEALNA